ncbi:MAG: hypothetical protein Kow0049_32100 [Stanieria sp.]
MAHSWSYHHLGMALCELGKYQTAVPILKQAIKLNPTFPWSYFHLGDALANQSQWDEAIAAYRHFLSLEPNVYGYERLGNVLLMQVNPFDPEAKLILKEALACYRRAIELEPTYLNPFYKAIELQPDNPELYFLLAQAYNKQEKLSIAVGFYQIGLQINSNYPEAYFELGIILERLGNLKAALDCYQNAIVLEPQEIKYVKHLKQVLDRQK